MSGGAPVVCRIGRNSRNFVRCRLPRVSCRHEQDSQQDRDNRNQNYGKEVNRRKSPVRSDDNIRLVLSDPSDFCHVYEEQHSKHG